MKRWILVASPALLLGLVWMIGRAPSRYSIEQACVRFQQERRAAERQAAERIGEIGREIGRAEDPEELRVLETRRQAVERERIQELIRIRRIQSGGWELVLIPRGAPKPDPGDFLVYGRYDPSHEGDLVGLHGEMEIWIAPRGVLPKLLRTLRLSP